LPCLEMWPSRCLPPEEWLFPGNRWHAASYPVTTKVLWSACQIAAERAGLDNRRIHPLACPTLPPPHRPSASHRAAPFGLHTIASHQTQPAPDPSAPAQTDAKYIGFREGGFLQVAGSEAPRLRACNCAPLRRGALQI
jgi:hypothetical protein